MNITEQIVDREFRIVYVPLCRAKCPSSPRVHTEGDHVPEMRRTSALARLMYEGRTRIYRHGTYTSPYLSKRLDAALDSSRGFKLRSYNWESR